MARDRPGGEPPAIGYALSHDGSKAIVLQRQDRRRFHDVLDTGTGESRRLLSRSFVDMRWGEDSDTAYATAADGATYRISFAARWETVKPVALSGEGGIPRTENPRVVAFPSPVSPVLFVRGDRRLYRCALDPAAGEAEIGVRCEIAEPEGRGTIRWLIAPGGRLAARIVLKRSGEREFQARAAGGGWRAVFRYTARYTELEIIGGVQADGTVWALSNRGRDSVALVRLDIATGAEEPVYRRRRFDVDRASALFDLPRAAGKPAALAEYRGIGHGLMASGPETRAHVAGRIADFLDAHLPVAPR